MPSVKRSEKKKKPFAKLNSDPKKRLAEQMGAKFHSKLHLKKGGRLKGKNVS